MDDLIAEFARRQEQLPEESMSTSGESTSEESTSEESEMSTEDSTTAATMPSEPSPEVLPSHDPGALEVVFISNEHTGISLLQYLMPLVFQAIHKRTLFYF